MPPLPPSLEMESVTKVFPSGVRALDQASLTVAPGAFVVVLGSSGAGKSTLLRAVNGLESVSAGHIRVDGMELNPRNLRRIRCRVGMIFQHFNLVPNLNVITNVLCGCLGQLNRLDTVLSWSYLFRNPWYQAANQALERVGLAEKAFERADKLSGGQQQRVGIARALMQRPRLLLADEPVASLDPVTGRHVMELLHAISREERLTVLVNLHQVELAREFADRIVGLNRGRVVFDGPAGQLTDRNLARIYDQSAPQAPESQSAPLTVTVIPPANFPKRIRVSECQS